MPHIALSAAGNSVCAFVHGFEPYFYVEAPPAFGPDDCDSLRAQLNVGTDFAPQPPVVVACHEFV